LSVEKSDVLQHANLYPRVRPIPSKRIVFWDDYKKKGFEYICRKYLDYTWYNIGKFYLKRYKNNLQREPRKGKKA
jgi:hypothetical protein